MLPQLQKQSSLNQQHITSSIIHEDHIRRMLAKTQNIDYKPWKTRFCPKNSHSPFGNFPKTHLNRKPRGKKAVPNFQRAQASTTIGILKKLYFRFYD